MMNRVTKTATAVALAGALAVSAATPSFARGGRVAAGVVGFAAGAMIGAAAANAGRGYYNGGYYGGGYAYDPGYAYAPGYAYEPDYVYQPAPRRYYRGSRCAIDGAYRPDYSMC